MKGIELLDTTLRDGEQTGGVSFSIKEKIRIVQAFDRLGIPFAEVGNPGSNPKDAQFFHSMKQIALRSTRIAAFGSTRRKEVRAESDPGLLALLRADTEVVSVFGKTSALHVASVLETTPEENLHMIADSVRFLRAAGRVVFFDAEHFFDGYRADPEYALACLDAAASAGAARLVLCDTNGGALPEEIKAVVRRVAGSRSIPVGIHCHNDCGVAVANAIAAVQAGADHVQGTFLGLGERCGNTDLTALLPNLQLKLGHPCIPPDSMPLLTQTAAFVADIAHEKVADRAPYVGRCAFFHKAGMHIDAMEKAAGAYEQIDPAAVGNSRCYLISEMTGRAALLSRVRRIDPALDKRSGQLVSLMAQIKDLEKMGYLFERADGSLELLLQKQLKPEVDFFQIESVQCLETSPCDTGGCAVLVRTSLRVDESISTTECAGGDLFHTLEQSLREALAPHYPELDPVRIERYELQVLDPNHSKVRAFVTAADGERRWTTVGVAQTSTQACLNALSEALELPLIVRAVAPSRW